MLSERARCSVDNLQYHFALEDAQQILQRRPDSWLGHVRLAEVYFATFNFEQAAASYQTAFQVQYSIFRICFRGDGIGTQDNCEYFTRSRNM